MLLAEIAAIHRLRSIYMKTAPFARTPSLGPITLSVQHAYTASAGATFRGPILAAKQSEQLAAQEYLPQNVSGNLLQTIRGLKTSPESWYGPFAAAKALRQVPSADFEPDTIRPFRFARSRASERVKRFNLADLELETA